MRICIDAGHGGMDTGALGGEYVEKYLNLSLALELRGILQRCGQEIHMTREGDTYLTLPRRSMVAKTHLCDLFLSIHFNAFDSHAKGFEAIHSLNNNKALETGNAIIDEVGKLGIYKRGVWTKESKSQPGHNWYGVLRYAEPIPGLILEGLFIDNPLDRVFLKRDHAIHDLASAYAIGICKAYGIPYAPETISPQPDGPIPKGRQIGSDGHA